MPISLHKQATTKPRNRAEIQASTEPAWKVAERYGIKSHARDGGVALVQQRLADSLVGLATRVGLHIGELAAEEFAGTFDGKGLGDVEHLQPP